MQQLFFVGSVLFPYQTLSEATVSEQMVPSMTGTQVLSQLSLGHDEPTTEVDY